MVAQHEGEGTTGSSHPGDLTNHICADNSAELMKRFVHTMVEHFHYKQCCKFVA